MANFLPSVNALKFTNDFPHEPDIQIGDLKLGDASRGLCGGMAWVSRDLYEAGLTPPITTTPPPPEEPLFKRIVSRLIDSFDVPGGLIEYLYWMMLSDREIAEHTLEQWSGIKAEIDSGHPASLGLVTVHSADPLQIGHNHQVLAYRYDQASSKDGPYATLWLYDPNSGPIDITWLILNETTGLVTHNVNIALPIRGFFLNHYEPPE